MHGGGPPAHRRVPCGGGESGRAGPVRPDSAASDDPADALERILSGREGGPVEGRTELSYEPLSGPGGSPTKIKNAMFGFAPEFEVGRTTGRSEAFGLSYEASYGETAAYAFSSEGAEGTARGRA